jgi:transglutaminase-like putative cysteine protease/tetratricopeptide (TPR) repeat protein
VSPLSRSLKFLSLVLITITPLFAADIWNSPSFSIDPQALRRAADAVKPEKHSQATALLNDLSFEFDGLGRLTETQHLIYRVENQQGVENWSETSGQWEAWHQAKPEIKVRVISTDGSVHWIDPKTLNDVPVHENAPDLYSDERRFGGPLPAIAPGVIVEEEVVTRDTAPLFAAGTVHRWILAWSIPVNRTHLVITHPDSLPLRYQPRLLPDAVVTKSHDNGIETITLDQGPIAAVSEEDPYVPPDLPTHPQIEFSTGTSWQQIAAEYARLTEDKVRPSDVQPLLPALNLKNAGRNEIIRHIVATLHRNIRYTGVEFGESNLIPQFPSETLKRKYGDCKDKATLLVAMLRAAGISAQLALLDSGPGRDVNPELPGMGMFDHAIVYVPASGSDPELWIDATAQYSQVGTLPWMDYGRSALVVSDKTESLKKTPELTAEQNLHLEFREFTLAEYGNATITEIDQESGPEEADYREYYLGDTKEVRQNTEEYVKDMYLADKLTSLEHADLADLDKSSNIKFVTKGRRGDTELTRAVAAIRVEGLFDRFPKYFQTTETDKAAAEPASSDHSDAVDDTEKPQPRTADWFIYPFATEWRYKIVAPLGFKLRALPSDKRESVGTATFSQHYSSNSDGSVVEAVLRVETTTTRMTVQQAKDLRDAVVKARHADPILITFDHIGQTLIDSGKIKEGLAAYRQIASQHPKEAVHKVQLAQAFLTAGLGEQARAVAREATVLEPTSALAFSTLAEILKHDEIGRSMHKGLDYDGAVAAYKKAVALDPKDKDTRVNLAILLEYDSEGTRYAEGAHLKEAVALFRELKKLDEDYMRTYEDNILYDLWYDHDYKGVLDDAAALPSSDVRKGFTLAAVAVLQGSDAALKKSLEMTSDEHSRSQALLDAGNLLMRVRKYPETSALSNAAAHGQSNGSQIARSAAIFASTKPFSELRIDSSDPRGAVQLLFAKLLSGSVSLAEMRSVTYTDPQAKSDEMDEKQFHQMLSTLHSQMRGADLPLPVIADLAVSNMRLTLDGDDSLGYKVIIEAPGAPTQTLFEIRDAGHYRIAGYSQSGQPEVNDLAFLALREVEKNNLPAARKWLDRARDEIHIDAGDDPLGGSLFPFFWTKGQEADAPTIRTAALLLVPAKHITDQQLSLLIATRDGAKNDLDRARLNLMLDYIYSARKNWSAMLPIATELMNAYPTSLRAFNFAVEAYTGLRRLDDWDQLVQSRIHAHPDELAYVRSSAQLAAYRNQFVKAREIIKGISDKGQANGSDLNLYSWYALELPGPIDQDTIDTAIRANDLTKNSNYAILHTLACVYAQAGKTSEARELLLKAMDAGSLEEPNSAVWLGFGLIAEQYGVLDAAESMFGRVEKDKVESPASNFSIAESHLEALHNAAKLSATSAR